MHFTTIAASAALVGSAIAGQYYETEVYYTTTKDYEVATYTSVSTCTGKEPKPTEPVYYSSSSSEYVPEKPYTSSVPSYGDVPTPEYPVTYTSLDYVTGDYGKVYTSTKVYVSTCKGGYPVPEPTYAHPGNYSHPPTYSQPPTYYPPHETKSYPVPVPTKGTEYPPHCGGYDCEKPETKTYEHPVPVPTKGTEYPPHCGGYECEKPETKTYEHPVPVPTKDAYPPHNGTTTYPPAPTYTGAASTSSVSFGVAAIAAIAVLFIAA